MFVSLQFYLPDSISVNVYVYHPDCLSVFFLEVSLDYLPHVSARVCLILDWIVMTPQIKLLNSNRGTQGESFFPLFISFSYYFLPSPFKEKVHQNSSFDDFPPLP